jgi:pimeloyl-ACP methyl ester carboxylesterase
MKSRWMRFLLGLVIGSSSLSVPRNLGAQAAPIHPPQRIEEAIFVRIGGIDQWVTIKGSDRTNPVVLFLHGGSGSGLSPFADSMFAGWDKDFTLVQWDQRGLGRTYGKNGPADAPDVTIDRMAQDGIEVAKFLTTHLGTRKVILVGGSWGTVLGIHMIQARPDLFYAYLGQGQFVNFQKALAESYARILAMAREAHDQPAVTALTGIGPPPWNDLHRWPVYHKVELAYQAKLVTAPYPKLAVDPAYESPKEQAQWSDADDSYWLHFVGLQMSGELTKVDLPSTVTQVSTPVFIVQGQEDLNTPADLAKAYLDNLKAPHKVFCLVPGAGHEPTTTILDMMHKVLVEQVRPLTTD